MKKRIISFTLTVLIAIGLIPMASVTAFAENSHEDDVRVIISNDTYSEEEGAPWEGELVDEWVPIDTSSTMMSCVVEALDNNGYEQTGAEDNYISSINGLSEFDGGGMSGWMGTLNDWFTNEGFGEFNVEKENFGAGDEIHIMYTLDYGNDLGGSWDNTDTWISSIEFSSGTLNEEFNPGYTAESGNYTLTLPAGTTEVNVKPTAANKNYMVRIFLNAFEESAETHYGDYEYKRNDAIPVKDGDIIYVGCGRENWPSMNESDGGHVYALNVVIPEDEEQTEDNEQSDYKTALNNTMAQLAMTVSAPAFGTSGGEWSVITLARGGYFNEGNQYFEDYYTRVEETVASKAASVNLSGALDKNKSTENSRLIMALSAIGKDPTNVGGVNVLGAYDANGINWIRKQGINGPIFTLIALDTKNYQTKDTTLRQQCVDFILGKELAGGGWALSGAAADPDITSMALQALVNYKSDSNVSAAAGRAIDALSAMQKDDGGFASWGSVNSESIAQVITALSAWGIDADKDGRFVKNGNSALDGLLKFYIPEGRGFAHVLTSGSGYTGGEVNGMATDQACYALVAYDRYVNGKTALYDMSDVIVTPDSESGFEEKEEKYIAALTLPQKIENTVGSSFNAEVYINDFPKDYRLMECVVTVPAGLEVTGVTMDSRISGGDISWYYEEETETLRIVYFDAEEGNVMTMSEGEFPAELMTIGFRLKQKLDMDQISISISSMSMIQSSDSAIELEVVTDESLIIQDESTSGSGTGSGTGTRTGTGTGTSTVVEGITFSAKLLYTGDDIDLIPSSKSAIAVAVTGIEKESELIYDDGTDKITMLYNAAASEKAGISTYLAIIPSEKPIDGFVKKSNYTVSKDKGESLVFGDTNQDSVINAQDALNSVNFWLRKNSAPNDNEILIVNVTGDNRINTFDALAVVENFVNGSEFAIVKKAAGVRNAA